MPPVNHSVTGTLKPTFLRSGISRGRSERATSRSTRLRRSSSTRQWSGSVETNSISWWSRNGTRASIEAAIVMRSQRSSRLSGSQLVWSK